MTPIQFLLSHRDAESSRKDIAIALLERGRLYGAERDFDREDLVRWFNYQVKRPRWFHQAALDIALEHGWTVSTSDAAENAIATLRSRDPHLTLDAIKALLGSAVVDQRMLDDAWLAATLTRKAK